jgi:DNA-binding NarL/FixJ family response regulator
VSIKILLVDDQALFREGLRLLLAMQLEVVGEAADGEAALRLAAELRPDVVLMDLRMPRLNGVEATRRLCVAQPACRVIVLTTFDEDADVSAGLRAGAVGYLLKDVNAETLVAAIQAAVRDEAVFQPLVAAKVVAEFRRMAQHMPPHPLLDEPLSQRECEILRCVARGASNREIANELALAEGTVKNYLTTILGKLKVRDRTQAALLARDMGLI